MAAAPPFHIRTQCRLCGSSALELAVPLRPIPVISPNIGEQTPGLEAFERMVAPLDVFMCRDCHLMQVTTIVDPALQYGNFLYRTSISLGLAEHFGSFAQGLMDEAKWGKRHPLVLDIGSNDGTLLRFFKDRGARVLGVDPAKAIANQATEAGIPTLGEFFDAALAESIAAEHGKADVIISNNTIANLDDLKDLFSGVEKCLAPDGIFVVETQYAVDLLEKGLLDVIYHEHLSYFSVHPVRTFVQRHGLQLYKAERIWPKGGSIRFYIQHAGGPHPLDGSVDALDAMEAALGMNSLQPYQRFTAQMNKVTAGIHDAVAAAASGGGIAAYGTSVGCASLINQFGLGSKLDFLVDDNPFKTRLIGPDYRLEVLRHDALPRRMPSLVVVLAWRYAEPIREKNQPYLAAGGRFLVPLPEVRLIDKARGAA